MTQFAQYDPAAPAPSRVIGWYDTAEFHYPNLPAAESLIEVTAAQWAMHFDDPNGWTVSNGVLAETGKAST